MKILLILLLLCGCTTLPESVDIFVKTKCGVVRRGHGVVVSPGRVWTVGHVIPGKGMDAIVIVQTKWGMTTARIVRRFYAIGSEDLVELQVGAPELLPPPAVFNRARKGDSGSPIMDEYGRVVGLISGVRGNELVLVQPPEENE